MSSLQPSAAELAEPQYWDYLNRIPRELMPPICVDTHGRPLPYILNATPHRELDESLQLPDHTMDDEYFRVSDMRELLGQATHEMCTTCILFLCRTPRVLIFREGEDNQQLRLHPKCFRTPGTPFADDAFHHRDNIFAADEVLEVLKFLLEFNHRYWDNMHISMREVLLRAIHIKLLKMADLIESLVKIHYIAHKMGTSTSRTVRLKVVTAEPDRLSIIWPRRKELREAALMIYSDKVHKNEIQPGGSVSFAVDRLRGWKADQHCESTWPYNNRSVQEL